MPEKTHNLNRKNASLRGSLSAAILISSLIYLASAEASGGSAPQKLSELEKTIVGNNNAALPIEQRLKQLELKVFAKVQAGSLSSRIAALEKFAGITDQMPPLPPQFDKGKEAIKAPERTVSSPVSKTNNQAAAAKTTQPLKNQLEEAVKLHHLGKEFEAEQSLKTILNNDPKNSDAYFSLGAIAETRGDLQSALEYYTSAMQANPSDSEARDAVAELSRKITAATNEPFINPLAPPPQPAASVLQGRALAVNASAGTANNLLTPQAGITRTAPIPTLQVGQPNPRSTFARTLARAALGAALTGAGLHCPACALLRGF